MPKNFRSYKLKILSTINYKEKKIIIIGFVIIKFIYTLSYYRVFKCLYENYSFNMLVIRSDYEISLDNAIKKCEFFSKILIQLFHFVQAICEKYQKI